MMKLRDLAHGDALCPVCALDGLVNKLLMAADSLELHCGFGHSFDMVTLSKIGASHGDTPEVSAETH